MTSGISLPMSGEPVNIFAASTNEQVIAIYHQFTEKDWREMAAEEVRAWSSEIHRRGLGMLLRSQLTLKTLPHERAMMRVLARESEGKAGLLVSETSLSTEMESAAAVEPINESALPSSEESFGALTPAASGFGIEEYLRLPLSAKRDAFVADGFLYVRKSVFRTWFNRLTPGKCCHARKVGQGHNSDCWLGWMFGREDVL